ncbi:MAG TPA: threonine synthase [Gemmatimonadaceae bacterium]|nr:threonine synthase [Gemmatimonadaceae bacterium]
MSTWTLSCSACGTAHDASGRVTTCTQCGQPLLAAYDGAGAPGRDAIEPRWDMWRYAAVLPVRDGETPVSLGEGMTPLVEAPGLARAIGVRRVWIKDEAINPTASFKARGLSAAVTRARGQGVPGVVVPTAGNAGAALAAYAAAAGLPARVYAPATTPAPILATIAALGADLQLVNGHIGDAGRLAREFAAESGYWDVSTLREPYRAEGNRTLGLELAEQLGWRLPDVVVYPTGGGEGVIGMWKAFGEMQRWGWVDADAPLPRMVVAQATGCAPLVRAFETGAERAEPWVDPATHAAGLRVPAPLGDRLVLRALRETGGLAGAADEEVIRAATRELARATGIDAAPEGGCALAVTRQLAAAGRIAADAEVVIYNTGSGASYRVLD